ncbi:hypothetical protein AB6A40_005293 [Gnathostoma spinigerum]|uniref:Phosphoribosyltransferase domain-containing protein n=1 Tax=Gnathostoma spinigerum TaxID=75299 RepID=A0ABD6EF13_9BILA
MGEIIPSSNFTEERKGECKEVRIEDSAYRLPENAVLLERTNQIIELQTILRDKNTDHSEFVFYADRLMRAVIEEGLNRLPYTKCMVVTPTGYKYDGIAFNRGNCGVSICRSGEAMEQALRQCCR